MSISLTQVVLVVSLGALVFIMVFCFAKRQITRFALKSSRGLHEPIGHSAPNALLTEIERRLKRVKEIYMEPNLISLKGSNYKIASDTNQTSYYYRMKAMDNVSELYDELKKCNPNSVKKAGIPFKVFLYEQRQSGCLEGMRLEIIEKFYNLYEHARYESKEFTKADYARFTDLLRLLINYIQTKTKITAKDVSPSLTDKSDKSDSSIKKLIPQDNKNRSALAEPYSVRYTPVTPGSRKLHENLVWSSSTMSNKGTGKNT